MINYLLKRTIVKISINAAMRIIDKDCGGCMDAIKEAKQKGKRFVWLYSHDVYPTREDARRMKRMCEHSLVIK